MAAKEENVEHLVHQMLMIVETECENIHATAEDVVSAAMTLALRTIKVTKAMHCDMSDIKSAVGALMLECMPDKPTGIVQ